ncbi:MAG TPA: hypothetical protein VK843_11340 [Planctomycetota bacterium]|nr:hypothetical protein [Planctomycetota bacterium]
MKSMLIWIPSITALVSLSAAPVDGGPQHRTQQTPPVKMGTSGGSANDASHLYCCGGTLGSLVRRDGVLCILSNNHILARSGSAASGEDTIQPGLIDHNCAAGGANIVGDFAGNIVPLGAANVDAALATARPTVDATGAIIDIGVPCAGTQAASLGLPVMKSGRTTGFTTGNITSINTSVQIQYQKGCNQGKKFNVVFTNQIVTGAMSAGGDSGSLLVSNDGSPNPVGLLFAGSSSTTIYNPIQSVVSAFTAGGHTFTFVGNSCLTTEGPAIQAPPAEELALALEIKVENEQELFEHREVLGVGIGTLEDTPTAAAIVVYLESSNGRVPAWVPSSLDGIPVRVILTDKIVAQ